MFEVGVYDAKTNLSAIIRRIQQGEECIITQRGKPVVRMVAAKAQSKEEITQAFDNLRDALKMIKPAKDWQELKEMIEEGRR